MMKPEITNISSDIQIYFIKTNNGRYYSSYIQATTIGFYPIEMNQELIQDFNTRDQGLLKERYGQHYKALHLFLNLKRGDLVVITSFRNQKVSIGEIIDRNHEGIFYQVNWMKEMELIELDGLIRYLHKKEIVLNITEIKTLIIRKLYPYYWSNGKYHLVLQIKQKKNLLLKSLLGLQQLILEGTNAEEMEVKIRLESPGIIEFISEHYQVIVLIIKLIGLLKQFKTNQNLSQQEQALYQAYCHYQIENLELEIEDNKQLNKS
jgi:hypothetical protein